MPTCAGSSSDEAGPLPFPDTGFFYTPPSRASSGGWNYAATAGRQGPLPQDYPSARKDEARKHDYGAIEPYKPTHLHRARRDGEETALARRMHTRGPR